MLSSKRQSDILQAVKANGSRSIAEIAEALGVTTETVRRNLKPLVERGLVTKFHGGVMLPEEVEEPPFQRRIAVNGALKRKVAELAARRIADGDSILLDNGTTTTFIADALADHANLTIVTNSAEIATRLVRRNGNRVFLAGGELHPDDAAVFGPAALDFIRQFRVRYALLSVAGITAAGDLMDFHLFEAEFTRVAMAQAEERWVIADHTKFGRMAPVRVGGLADIDLIISDAPPPADLAEAIAGAGTRLVTP